MWNMAELKLASDNSELFISDHQGIYCAFCLVHVHDHIQNAKAEEGFGTLPLFILFA